jgi:uncharacterized protein YacL
VAAGSLVAVLTRFPERGRGFDSLTFRLMSRKSANLWFSILGLFCGVMVASLVLLTFTVHPAFIVLLIPIIFFYVGSNFVLEEHMGDV